MFAVTPEVLSKTTVVVAMLAGVVNVMFMGTV